MINIDVNALADALAERLLQPETTQWMTIAEAAEHMRCSDKWIRGRLDEIPHVKVDGKLLFRRDELDSFLTNHRRR